MILPGTRTLRLGPVSALWRPRTAGICLALMLVCLLLALLLLGTGMLRLSPLQVVEGLAGLSHDATATRVLRGIRLPRVLTAALVGASLGMAGAVFQSLSRNPLGSPDVIGFTTGAATGAILQIILFNAGPFQVASAAVASGLVTALVVLTLARGAREGGGYRLILIGIGVGAVLTGVNTMLMVMGSLDRAMSAQIWLAGSLNARSWAHVWTVLAGLCLFMPLVLLSARRLAVLELGEDIAVQLGVGIGRSRALLVIAAVGLTAVATASAGPIAFIALAGPQIARRLTRTPGVPLLSGALTGAALLLAADLLSQRAPFGLLLPIGSMTGMCGGLYLVWLLGGRRA
ncbi:MAG: iron chelate uptake ABC transporter family permease subunit [Paracoccus sp. (in: a-proteobacteria)]|uniref:FecCD family ABC transporter permease n=1 Tax=Paracoccus sp. TaxID=267 RepID=UPI0026DF3D3D|nr:iron chelate uptake ABC transporter family permease subunit [Paracoccus sp. (in: a-proteobacteria)]MDO5622933.1 iron chelate uptake ABC transporter family permease subunit [Paracoccus sp. (in: a-proteobacteria)]